MLFGMSATALFTIGKPVFREILNLFKNKKNSKEFKFIALLQQNDSEELLDHIIGQIEERKGDLEAKPMSNAELELLLMQLAIVRRSVDRVGDMLRGEDDDIPQVEE